MNPAYFIFLFASVIILIVVLSIRSYRRYQENLARTFMECGYFEVPHVDAEIKSALEGPWAVASKHNSGNRRVIGKAFRYNTGGMELYIFDPEPSNSSSRAIIIRSSQLSFPRFILSPKIPIAGKLGSLLNALSEKIISRQLPAVKLNSAPEFDARYVLFGNEHERIREIFAGGFIRWLVQSSRRFMISADGSILTLSYVEAANLKQLRRRRPLDGDYIRELTSVARELYQNLYDSRRHERVNTV